jgi:hypothetical protein
LNSNPTYGQILRYYVDFPASLNGWYDLLETWFSGTHIYHSFLHYPQILMEQNVQTGKSRIMEVGVTLSYEGEKYTNVTYASLRDLASQGHTLFIDEFTKTDPNTMKILKNGWSLADGWDTKNVKGQPVRIPTYSPKMYGTNSSNIDVEVKQRCILMPTLGTTKPIPQFNSHAGIWDKVRKDRASYMQKNLKTIMSLYENAPRTVMGLDLGNREYQMWSPLLAIARSLGLNVDQVCRDTVLYSRTVMASRYPEYYVLRTLDRMVSGPLKQYSWEDIDREIRISLSPEEKPYYHSGELGTQMGRIFGPTLVKKRLQHGSRTVYMLDETMKEDAIKSATARGIYIQQPDTSTPTIGVSDGSMGQAVIGITS